MCASMATTEVGKGLRQLTATQKGPSVIFFPISLVKAGLMAMPNFRHADSPCIQEEGV